MSSLGVWVRTFVYTVYVFFFQAEDGIRDLVRSRGLGDVYKRQDNDNPNGWHAGIFTTKFSASLKKKNGEIRKIASTYILSLIHI